jgi:hypothetical protein
MITKLLWHNHFNFININAKENPMNWQQASLAGHPQCQKKERKNKEWREF